MGGAYEGIVVLGFPRSGTTLVRRILDAHPEVSCPPETNLLRAAARFLAEEPFAGGLAHGPLCGLGFSGIDEARVIDALRELVFGLWRELAVRRGARVWAEKSTFDAFHLDAVERLCGDCCRFVIIERHPLDVACSVRDLCDRMGSYPAEIHHYVCRQQAPLIAFVVAWCDVSRRLQRFEREHAARTVRISYESLVANPVEDVNRLIAGLDLVGDAGELIAAALAGTGGIGLGDWRTYERATIGSDRVGRWRALDAAMAARMASVVRERRPDSDYELPDEAPPGDPSDVRRQYEIRTMASRLTRAGAGRGDEAE